MKDNQYNYKRHDVLKEESNFDRMKRKRKRREAVTDMLFTIAAMLIVALGIAVVITS